MTTKDDGGPAFPFVIEEEGCITQVHRGMTLRDYFAGQALAGLLAGYYSETTTLNLDEMPTEAFAIADAMLAARK